MKTSTHSVPAANAAESSEISEEISITASEQEVRRSLKSRVFRAGTWVMAGHFIGLALRLAGTLALSRLLAPDIFGMMSIVTVIQVVIALLSDVGIHPAIIQSPNGDSPAFLNTAWTIQIIRGFWIWGGCLICSIALYFAQIENWVPAGSTYAAPVLPWVLASASFSAVLLGFQSMKGVILNRKLELGRLAVMDLFSGASGLCLSAALAFLTHSIWSFVAGNLFSSTIIILLSHFFLPGLPDCLAWNRKVLDEIMRFGRWIFLSSMVGVLGANGDRLLFGAYVEPAMLGYYSIALNLATIVEGIADRLFGSVSLATLSEVAREQPERFAPLYFKMRWPVDIVFVGMAGFLFASGQAIVKFLYDPRYHPAGLILQILSFSLLFSRYRLAQKAYVAIGRPAYEAITNVVKVISLFLVVPLLYHEYGFDGAICGVAFHALPVVICMFWLNRRFGMNNVKLEITVLLMWPAGWLAGTAFAALITGIKGML